ESPRTSTAAGRVCAMSPLYRAALFHRSAGAGGATAAIGEDTRSARAIQGRVAPAGYRGAAKSGRRAAILPAHAVPFFSAGTTAPGVGPARAGYAGGKPRAGGPQGKGGRPRRRPSGFFQVWARPGPPAPA